MNKFFGLIIAPFLLSAVPRLGAAVPSSSIQVEAIDTDMRLLITGEAADQLFHFLNAASVEVDSADSASPVRKGEGLECEQSLSGPTTCIQTFDSLGYSSSGLYSAGSISGLPYTDLKFHGTGAQLLYEFLNNSADHIPLADGSDQYLHIGNRITCTRTVSNSKIIASDSYACDQVVVSNGYAKGSGTDPIVNIGTRELTISL